MLQEENVSMGGRGCQPVVSVLATRAAHRDDRAAKVGAYSGAGGVVLLSCHFGTGQYQGNVFGRWSVTHSGHCPRMTRGSACSRPSCFGHRYSTHVHRVG